MKRLASYLAAAAALLPLAVAAQTPPAPGDPNKGAQKVAMCQGCHGIPGYHTVYPEVYKVPKLGGQHPAYIVKALTAYKSGERDFATMRAIASSLSEKDMADLAAYYGGSGSQTAAAK